jgi:protein SCO1
MIGFAAHLARHATVGNVLRGVPLLAVAVALLAVPRARADSDLPPIVKDVRFDQRLNEQVPLDLRFRDELGRWVHLSDYFQGKPVVLIMAYYRCPRLCNEVLQGLLKSLKGMSSFDVGNQFQVVTVSFDSRETPDLAAGKKQSAIERYGRPGTDDGWHFLTGSQKSIDALAAATGFKFVYDPDSEQFAHAAGIMVLTPDGKLSRYFYGIDFPSRDLRLGLVEASAGKIGTPFDGLLLYCFHYDSTTGRYTASVLNLVRLSGGVTILALIVMFGVLLRRRKPSAAAVPVSSQSDEIR